MIKKRKGFGDPEASDVLSGESPPRKSPPDKVEQAFLEELQDFFRSQNFPQSDNRLWPPKPDRDITAKM